MAGRWQVGELAALAKVTVRTLHHYDQIGLLEPSDRSGAGYRLYSDTDLERLYRILLFRELGFQLDRIAELLDAPAAEQAAALTAQRDQLLAEQRRMDAVIRALDHALESMEKGVTMGSDEMAEGFDAFANAPEDVRAHQATHGDEARERWGDTDAYSESMRRAGGHSSADWEKIRQEDEGNQARMATLLAAGADPEGSDAMAGAEAMRLHISRWFYDCSPEAHAALADMYETDPRFTAFYEKRAGGLAAFVASAIRANARRGRPNSAAEEPGPST